MSLYVVATPIGNPKDISLRSIELIQKSEFIIGEERKEVSKLLKQHDIKNKTMLLLNEHSKKEELFELVEICKKHLVVLVSDCGTPGFCDPGADLVNLCRKEKIEIFSVPGPSSLMTFLSIIGVRLDSFLFLGFLSNKKEERIDQLKKLKNIHENIILMDTPYRLKRLLEELQLFTPQRQIKLGINLSTDQEKLFEGKATEVLNKIPDEKAEFILCVMRGT